MTTTTPQGCVQLDAPLKICIKLTGENTFVTFAIQFNPVSNYTLNFLSVVVERATNSCTLALDRERRPSTTPWVNKEFLTPRVRVIYIERLRSIHLCLQPYGK